MSTLHDHSETTLPCSDARPREGMYRLLGRLYREEIDAELLEQLERDGALEALREAGLDIDVPQDRPAWLEQLAVEYTRLFIGPGPHVSPHESVHAPDGSNLLNSERTAMVRRFIAAAGFEFEPSYSGYPDHISTEFEFMEALIGCQLASLDEGNSEETDTSLMLQREFADRHLSKWLPAFCDRVAEQAELPLYASLASVTKEFIDIELAQLQGSHSTGD